MYLLSQFLDFFTDSKKRLAKGDEGAIYNQLARKKHQISGNRSLFHNLLLYNKQNPYVHFDYLP